MTDAMLPPSPPMPPPWPAPAAPEPPKKVPLWQNVGVIVLCLICCWPVGLAFTWMHPTWTTKTKGIITGIIAALALVSFGASLASKPTIKTETPTTVVSSDGASTTVEITTTTAHQPTTTAPATTAATTTTAAPTTTTTAAPTTTSTTVPPTTANGPEITQAEFDAIKIGMTEQEVIDIVGGKCPISSEMELGGTIMTTWDCDGEGLFGSASLSFTDGVLDSRMQFGL